MITLLKVRLDIIIIAVHMEFLIHGKIFVSLLSEFGAILDVSCASRESTVLISDQHVILFGLCLDYPSIMCLICSNERTN